MTRFAIGLGSNLGERLDNLRTGVAGLEELGQVVAISAVYGTEPVGGPSQGPYLNAVALLDTDLEPVALLEALAAVEAGAGRIRGERWGPRTLDLDILVSDRESVSTESLVVPHPRVGEREFALRPLAEVWPDAPLGPELTAAEALDRVGPQGVAFLASSWLSRDEPHLGRVLVAVQLAWFAGIALAMAWDGSLPEGELEPTRLAGFALAVLGAGLVFVASRRLGPGLRPSPEPRPDAELVETGPYALVRHPIYGGVTLFILGAALILDSLVGSLLSIGLGGFFYVKSQYEERRLLLRYPSYHAYRERVPRRLIPFLI